MCGCVVRVHVCVCMCECMGGWVCNLYVWVQVRVCGCVCMCVFMCGCGCVWGLDVLSVTLRAFCININCKDKLFLTFYNSSVIRYIKYQNSLGVS